MSDYTATLAETIELLGGREKFEALALSDYQIFDEDYRPHLNDMLIEHYLMREIGDETVYGFCRQLRNRMRESAPIFNGLYHSCKMKYDPVSTMGYEIVTESSSSDSRESTSESSQKSRADNTADSQTRNLEMPNTRLVDDRDYASSGANTKSGSTAEQDSSGTGSDHSTGSGSSTSASRGAGYQGDPNRLVAEYRQNLISVDAAVMKMVEPCFMMLWQSGDSWQPASMRDIIGVGGPYGIYW